MIKFSSNVPNILLHHMGQHVQQLLHSARIPKLLSLQHVETKHINYTPHCNVVASFLNNNFNTKDVYNHL